MLKALISMSVIVTGLRGLIWLGSLLSGAIWAVLIACSGLWLLWYVLKRAREQKGN